MARTKTVFECTNCGDQVPRWMGQCLGCGAWNSLVESLIGPNAPAGPQSAATSSKARTKIDHSRSAVPLSELAEIETAPLPTHITEFDRVLGGGLVPGSITVVGGEPGVGKSTLLTQVVAHWPKNNTPALTISAEESPQQVSARFTRLELSTDNVHVGGECDINSVLSDIEKIKPGLVVVDSIQTVFDPELSSAPGSVSQVRQCAHRLALAARESHAAIVLVGQVTKDGSLAGPRVLEHLVDTVLAFDGERELGLRVLRALKHRFGATGELGVFEMTGTGLAGVEDPSQRMLADRLRGVAGSAVAVTLEGRRAVLLEVQALSMDSGAPVARRATQGYDQKRFSMLLAVLSKHVGMNMGPRDVYLSVVGGLSINEPGADLAVAAAIVSSTRERPIPSDLVLIGEIGLGGELRSASSVERRLAEASRLGFTSAIIPKSDANAQADIALYPAETLSDAFAQIRAVAQENAQN